MKLNPVKEFLPTMLGQEFFQFGPSMAAFCYTQHHFQARMLHFGSPIVTKSGAGYTFGVMIFQSPKISRREWVFAVLVALFAAGLAAWPVIHGYINTPPGQTYLGTIIPDVIDSQVYYANIQENADGHVLYRNLFTGEPQPAVWWHPLWLVLGGISHLTGWSAIVVMAVAKAVLGISLVMAVYYFCGLVIREVAWRRVGLIVAVFGAGVGGWLLLVLERGIISILSQPWLIQYLPTDVSYPAASPFLTMTHSAQFIFAQLLLLLTLIFFLRATEKAQKPYLVYSGISAGILGLVHPYDPLLLFGIVFAWLVVAIMRSQITPDNGRQYVRQAMILLVYLLPAIVYYLFIVFSEPAIRTYYNQNVIKMDSARSFLLGVGLLGPLAVLGLKKYWNTFSQTTTLLAGWIVVAALLLYAPGLTFQVKMIAGLCIPLGLAATLGLMALYSNIHPRYRTALVPPLAVILTLGIFITPVVMVAKTISSQKTEPKYHYVADDVITALTWIKNNTPADSIIFGDVLTGNLVPHYAGRSTYVGHHHQTINFETKRNEVRQWFFADAEAPDAKAKYLEKRQITHIFWGPNERALGSWLPASIPTLTLVYTNALATVYRVGRD